METKKYVVATCIDPHYKDQFLHTIQQKNQAAAWLLEELTVDSRSSPHSSSISSGGSDDEIEGDESDDSANQLQPHFTKIGRNLRRTMARRMYSACALMRLWLQLQELDSKLQKIQKKDTHEHGVSVVAAANEVDRFLKLPLSNRSSSPLLSGGVRATMDILFHSCKNLLGNCSVHHHPQSSQSDYTLSTATFSKRNEAEYYQAGERNFSSYTTTARSSRLNNYCDANKVKEERMIPVKETCSY